jgi:hypothetical protein
LSSDSPSYSFLLNGEDASDYFTTLTANRAVRQRVGSFNIILDDDNFETWASLAKYQPVIFEIDGTRIFKGRIDTVVRHFDKTKSGGYITTVSGRDDGGALQDAIISAWYTDYLSGTYINGSLKNATPTNILDDLLAKYIAQKGTKDPTITLGTVDFGETAGNYNYALEIDREGTWQGIEQLCQAVEGKSALLTPPTFLDFWVDPTDKLYLTQTGEIVDDIDAGTYGGDFIKVRDWTEDALPLKNDIWVFGDAKAGILPLDADPYYLAATGQATSFTTAVPSYLYTTGPAAAYWFGEVITPVNTIPTIQSVVEPHFYKTINPGPIVTQQGITITNSTNVPLGAPSGDQSLQIHIDPFQIFLGVLSTPLLSTGSFAWLSGASVYWGIRFDNNNYPGAPWINLCQQPRNHFNFKNSAMSETMGEVNGFYATVQVRQPSGFSLATAGTSASFACDFFAEAVDGQTYPMRMTSPLSHYAASNFISNFLEESLPTGWARLFFPLGPSAGGSLQPTNQGGFQTGFFNWFDVQEIHFGINLNFFTAFPLFGAFDIYFADLMFVKQLVARGRPIPTDTVRPTIVTDSTIPNYQFAFNKANAYALSLAIPQSYIDYDIYGRPDLQVGHVFTAEGGPLLIRESTTTVVKDAGYGVHVKAWKPLARAT